MKLIDTYEVLGFTHWASALFNADDSGMEAEDIAMLDEWLDDIPTEYKIPCDMLDDEGFRHDVYAGLGGDSVTYVFPIYNDPEDTDQ